MPIEIKELVVRTIVTDNHQVFDGDYDDEKGDGSADTNKIIEASVQKVLKILKKAKSR